MSNIIGPVIPPHLLNSKSDDEDAYGPRLPPNCKQNNTSIRGGSEKIVGPTLPPGFNLNAYDSDDDSDSDDIIGPQLPSDLNASNNVDDVRQDIQRRALKMKQKLSGEPDSVPLEREEWMTVLPPEMSKNFGLGPRSFHRQTPQKTGDRSGWTETPSTSSEIKEKSKSKSKREQDDDKMKRKIREKYDEEMSKITEKHHKKSKRDESLYDIHTKERTRKKDKDKSSKERTPFDRDKDLKVNFIDSSKRAAMVKQSKLLNSNFSHGEGKFL